MSGPVFVCGGSGPVFVCGGGDHVFVCGVSGPVFVCGGSDHVFVCGWYRLCICFYVFSIVFWKWTECHFFIFISFIYYK